MQALLHEPWPNWRQRGFMGGSTLCAASSANRGRQLRLGAGGLRKTKMFSRLQLPHPRNAHSKPSPSPSKSPAKTCLRPRLASGRRQSSRSQKGKATAQFESKCQCMHLDQNGANVVSWVGRRSPIPIRSWRPSQKMFCRLQLPHPRNARLARSSLPNCTVLHLGSLPPRAIIPAPIPSLPSLLSPA